MGKYCVVVVTTYPTTYGANEGVDPSQVQRWLPPFDSADLKNYGSTTTTKRNYVLSAIFLRW
jgi:hypothetical protein